MATFVSVLFKLLFASLGCAKLDQSVQVKIGDAECLAIRISYTGELGWEIYPKM